MFNSKFGRIISTGSVEHPDAHPTINGRVVLCPTREQYHGLGYLPIVNNPPEPPEGYHATASRCVERDGEIVTEWQYEKDVPVPRRWTRLKINLALANAGWREQVLQILAGVELAPGYTADKALGDCDYIEEWFPDAAKWESMLNAVAVALGVTRKQVNDFIDSIPTEG